VSRASRLAAADTRIQRPRDAAGRFAKRVVLPQRPAGWQLGLNAAQVPGGISTVSIGTVVAGGRQWDPDDAAPHAASIGYALAVETASAPS